jgi:hypothetical protein
MTIRRRLLLAVALIVLFATAIEYGLVSVSTSTAVAAGNNETHTN